MINLHNIKQLLVKADEHTLSLYLNVNPGAQENQSRTPAWQIELKNALKNIEERIEAEHKALWSHSRDQVDRYSVPVTES